MMPYFPREQETAYRCPGCGGLYVPTGKTCLVLHSPGTCCHQYEKLVPTPVQGQKKEPLE